MIGGFLGKSNYTFGFSDPRGLFAPREWKQVDTDDLRVTIIPLPLWVASRSCTYCGTRVEWRTQDPAPRKCLSCGAPPQ